MAGSPTATPEGVRPGAQEAASSARRRRGNRRRWTGPYTPAWYYGFVYMSTPEDTGGWTSRGRNWRYNSAALNTMKAFLGIVELTLALLVMLGVLLQTPKASGLGGTIGGSGDIGGGYRRRRGLERSLLRITAVLIGLFVLISAINTYVGSH